MQKNRNIRLLVLLGVLITATISAFFLFRDGGETLVDKNIFKVADLSQIDQVVLTKEGKTITLKFDGSRWRVNNQLADRRMIDVLFATLQQAEPKRPVAELMQDSISKVLNQQGVQVSLYTSGEIQKEFLAGGNSGKTQAYFKNSSDAESFIMIIPGYRVYASGIFELDENGWKDKYVFSFNWKNFQNLKASFPSNPKSDFEIAMGKEYFEVKGVALADTTKLNDFLDAVSLLTVDEYVNKGAVTGYDSLVSSNPILNLQVSDVSGKSYSLLLYETGDRKQVLGVIQDAQPALFDKRKVTAILKNKNWFIRN